MSDFLAVVLVGTVDYLVAAWPAVTMYFVGLYFAHQSGRQAAELEQKWRDYQKDRREQDLLYQKEKQKEEERIRLIEEKEQRRHELEIAWLEKNGHRL